MIGTGAAWIAMLVILGTTAAQAEQRWIVTCAMPQPAGNTAAPASAPASSRVFRLGPGLFQELQPDGKAFGPNLCMAFPCVREPGRLVGVISSSTLVLTVTLDPDAGAASWKTVGASGLARPSGDCALRSDIAAAPP